MNTDNPSAGSHVSAPPETAPAESQTPVAKAEGFHERLAKFRRQAPLRDLLPLEATLGPAVPVRRAKRLLAYVPFLLQSPREGGGVNLSAVVAHVYIDYTTGRVVEFANLVLRDGVDPKAVAGVFPHPELAGLSARQYLDLRNTLTGDLDDMFRLLAAGKPLPTALCDRLSDGFSRVIAPVALTAYRAAAPKFMERFCKR